MYSKYTQGKIPKPVDVDSQEAIFRAILQHHPQATEIMSVNEDGLTVAGLLPKAC